MIPSSRRNARRHRVLVVDDDPSVRAIFADALAEDRFELRGALDGGEGLYQIEQWQPDLVVLDHKLPDRAGLELLPEITAFDRHLPILFLTATQSADTAIQAMKLGAFEYATKPVPLDQLADQVDRGIESRRLLRTPVVMQEPETSAPQTEADDLIGRCAAMQNIYKSIGRLAAHDLPCLIQGETGTGKKLAARAIHAYGQRSQQPIRTLRCRDYDSRDIRRELFGCDRSGRTGLLEACHGGTVILEEIGDLPAAVQSWLLTQMRRQADGAALDDNVGARHDVTLIFTTTGDVDQLVTTRRVRSDLFYELSGSILALPPLRDRGGDIRLLVEHYVQKLLSIRSVQPEATVRVSDAAIEILSSYHWPGNVAELKSVLRRALMESRGTVLASEYLRGALGQRKFTAVPNAPERNFETQPPPHDGSETPAAPASSTPEDNPAAQLEDRRYWEPFVAKRRDDHEGTLYSDAVERLEKGLIAATLEATQGNLAHAARLLGMTRVSLRKKIQKLDMEIPGRARQG